MIKRLYVDNFKCMVNFEYEPGSLQLMFGENGTGKTTAFVVLEGLKNFITLGSNTDVTFPSSTLTMWQSRPEQRFELEIDGNGGRYLYILTIEHNLLQNKARIKKEELRFDGNSLYAFDGQEACLFHDDYSEGPRFPFDWSRSGIASIQERHDNQKLSWFRLRMAQIYIFAIDPLRIENYSLGEQSAPYTRLENYVSWYRHLAQESPKTMGPFFDSLREVIEGFDTFKLTREGEARLLRVIFHREQVKETETGELSLMLGQLSEGQRCLIALFTILHFAVRSDTTVCIDEPDNFVALRELQPWILQLSDKVKEQSGQCLIVSHHPEFINQLAVKQGSRFSRTGLGTVRIRPFEWSDEDAIMPSEIVARGWAE